MAAAYFISYALMATVAGLVIGWAQYSRLKRESTPINMTIMKATWGIALAMWSSAAVTSVAYDSSTQLIAGSLIGVLFISFFAWQMNQVTKKIAEDERQLKALATRDSLTNLWNRRVFQETLDSEVARSRRYKLPLAVLMLNIDNLSEINGKYGYKIGDAVLRELSKRLQGLVRIPDSVCRFRGEVISLILPMTPMDAAEFFANRLRQTMAETPFTVGEVEPISLTISCGVSAYSERTDTDAKIVESCRLALEAANRDCGNAVRVCPEAWDAFQAAKSAQAEAAQSAQTQAAPGLVGAPQPA